VNPNADSKEEGSSKEEGRDEEKEITRQQL
jgi:hypothetical protein